MKKKSKIYLSIGIISLLLVIGTYFSVTEFQILGLGYCSYSGEGVYRTATCNIETDYINPDYVANKNNIGVESLDVEYAPDCSFEGTIKLNPWSTEPNKILWSGKLYGYRSGSTCILYESFGDVNVGGQSVKVKGTLEFSKIWHECEVCPEPGDWSECEYDINWERWQQSRVNYYCGGKYTNWKCKSYIEYQACEGKKECETNQDCINNNKGNYCIEGLCHNLIFPGQTNPTNQTNQINSIPDKEAKYTLIYISLIILIIIICLFYFRKDIMRYCK